jgi:hypothetical protein
MAIDSVKNYFAVESAILLGELYEEQKDPF